MLVLLVVEEKGEKKSEIKQGKVISSGQTLSFYEQELD